MLCSWDFLVALEQKYGPICLQELGRAKPATLLRLSVIFTICLVFRSEQYCPFQASNWVKYMEYFEPC